ncbi:MAG: AraC family transcriptional regulator [Candidatus Lokiarchaeota archaeon]|nr:AraC family transcriptional regulator [Candidatus Lokiarchaeota archaeon]
MELKEIKELKTLSIRTKSPVEKLPNILGEGYGEIMKYIGELGIEPTGEPFVIYYNMDMSNLDIELGFPVAVKHPNKGRVQSSKIPGGKFATTLHVGPYETVEKSYNELNAFIISQGHEAQNWVIEAYLNDPRENPGEEPKTMIYIPLK